ncbi:hypothetical protein P7L75_01435 (plasmid) [Tistrella mobilis]|uniref:hypothetical protein n=1 Tax=Tistrella mobilis TaxID=171437 RepID=UPI003556DD49
MVALNADRAAPSREAARVAHPVAAGVQIYTGAIVCLNAAGYAVPGSTATGLKPAGIATVQADNRLGDDGDMTVVVRRDHAWRVVGQGVTRAHISGDAYAVDDQTVAPTDGGGTRSKIGRIVDIDDAGVWIEVY